MGKMVAVRPFRLITDLQDSDIRQIITDLFKPIRIKEIRRWFSYQEVDVSFVWDWNGEKITDSVRLTVPTVDNCGIDADFSVNADDCDKYNKFLLAKGVNPLLENNPYLEVIDEH